MDSPPGYIWENCANERKIGVINYHVCYIYTGGYTGVISGHIRSRDIFENDVIVRQCVRYEYLEPDER